MTPVSGNLQIALFSFGAVLLLLGLVGGRFKIFGAEIVGSVGWFMRILAGVAGVVLVTLALLSNAPSPRPPRPIPTPTPTPSPPPPPRELTPKRLIIPQPSNPQNLR
jgi:hypothetical protein